MFPTMADIRGKMVPACGCAFRRRSRLRQRPHTAGDVRQWCSASSAEMVRQCAASCGSSTLPRRLLWIRSLSLIR